MMRIKINRMSHMVPDLNAADTMIAELKEMLRGDVEPENQMWKDNLRDIMRFQRESGDFSLFDSYKIPMDARVAYCHTPTYICTAILMKAFMKDKTLFEGEKLEILEKALQACCEIRIFGNGMEFFEQADIIKFLDQHHGLCPKFSRIMNRHCRRVFVYGTLMKGEANHHYYLQNETCLGKATASGFEMYDIGAFPGIVQGEGLIPGELYEVSHETLRKLDYLEGEGSLYIRKSVSVKLSNGKKAFAWIYIYNDSVDGLKKIPVWRSQDYVWYVSYGSNMLRKRFMHYIRGGAFEGSRSNPEACEDLSAPLAVRTCEIPYDMYFGNESHSWEDKGVAFLDITKPGSAKGVAYLITREQFDHVARQENGGCLPETNVNWYNKEISLESMDGIKAVTFTNDRLRDYHEPSEAYWNTLKCGLHDNYPELTEDDIEGYLKRGGIRNRY